jgi:hypothetical protein
MTAQRTGKAAAGRRAGAGRRSASRGRSGTVAGISLFAAFVVGIVAWIVIGTSSSGAGEAAASAPMSHGSPPAAPTPAAPSVPAPTSEAAPSTTSSAVPSTTAAKTVAKTVEIPPGETANSVFLDVVAGSGMAPPATNEEQLAMARDACTALDGGMSHEQLVQAFISSGATAAEAENFIQLSTATICPQHAGA